MPLTDQNGLREDGLSRPPGPGVRTLLAALSVGLGTAIGVSGLGRLATDSLAILALLFELGLLAGVVSFLMVQKVEIADVLRFGEVPPSTYWPALQLGVALVIANMAAAALVGPPPQQVELVTQAAGVLEWAALIVLVVFAAPLIEEVLFRGLIQGALEARLGHWGAIILAGAGFAAVHGLQAAPFFFFWSLPVGWVTWRSRSIRPAVAVHGVNNLTGVVLLLLTPEPVSSTEAPDLSAGSILFAVMILALMGLWALTACRDVGQRLP